MAVNRLDGCLGCVFSLPTMLYMSKCACRVVVCSIKSATVSTTTNAAITKVTRATYKIVKKIGISQKVEKSLYLAQVSYHPQYKREVGQPSRALLDVLVAKHHAPPQHRRNQEQPRCYQQP